MGYSNAGRIERTKNQPSKIENFNSKVDDALSLLENLKISDEEKELLKMSLDSMNEFVANYYGKKK